MLIVHLFVSYVTFSIPPGVRGWLRLLLVALPGLFCLPFCSLWLSLLKQGFSEPEFYGDLVYKFRKYFGRKDFSNQLKNIIRTGYNINVLRQGACFTANNFAALLNCMPAGRASD